MLNKTPKKLIKINLGNISNNDLIEILEKRLEVIHALNDEYESFMVEISKNNFWVIA